MCRVLDASRAGYYCWLLRQDHPSVRQQRQSLLDQRVKEVFATRKARSGSPMITLDLKDEGQSFNRKTVAASMQRQGLRAKAAK